jgi:putative nucleotidyltransferase with HDIG domain
MAASNRNSTNGSEEVAELKVSRLRVGSRLLQDAYSGDGSLLLRAGAPVDSQLRLQRLLQPDVRFGPDRSPEIPVDLDNEAELDAAYGTIDPRIEQFFENFSLAKAIKHEAIEDVKELFRRVNASGEIDLGIAQNIASRLLGCLVKNPAALVSLSQLKDVDKDTFAHSVNVGILAMYLAIHTEYREKIEDLGIGALLHDVGKSVMPIHILHKQGPLSDTEMQLMKRHPVVGYETLRRSGENRQSVLSCVRSHHEKVNGKGYPDGKRGPQINPHAMVTSIADIYDALTTDRPYRRAYNPKDALDLMLNRMASELEHSLLQCFAWVVGHYPVGSEIELSDGRIGTVLKHYATDPDKPTIMVHTAKNGRRLASPQILPLSSRPDLYIKGFVQNEEAQTVEIRSEEQDLAA